MSAFLELASEAARNVSTVYVETSSGGEEQALKLIFLLSGPVYFAVMYARYRNKGARHRHEDETEASITNVTGSDQHVRRITGTSNSSLSGANDSQVRGARNEGFM